MGMDTVLMEQAERQAQMREQDKAQARLVVAGASQSIEDCAFLLRVLGLIEDES